MKTILTILFVLALLPLKSQKITEPLEMFNEGQFFFQRADYKEALYFFKRLTKEVPDNANYNFKVGECYLNIPGQEHLAVSYFEKAILKTVSKKQYRPRLFEEDGAPIQAIFYLGNAYRADGQLDEALKAYAKFIDSPYFYGNYNLSVVENEIRSCERAKIIQDAPVEIEMVALNSELNTNYSEFNAVKSKDGKSMVFIRGLKFYDAIFYSTMVDGEWTKPVNINQDVVSDGDFYPTGLNSDGTKLLLVRDKDLNSDIYISNLKNGEWTAAQRLPGKANSMLNETYASFGNSDNTIYLVSDKQGGRGGKDIYVSKIDSKGRWGKPKNISKAINTRSDEETPVVCENEKTLFFSSKSHYNMGGYDVFYSFYKDGEWSVPRNVGYPINTTRDDLFFVVDETCKHSVYSIIDTETGFSDIYDITIVEPLATPEQK